jgi:SAM-dependent methyltransferase
MEIRANYDPVATAYANRFIDELSHKPFDCKMLDWLAEKVNGLGPICDMGCGPAQVARYLHQRRHAVVGVDLSAEMVREAQRLNPEFPIRQGDMLALAGIADESFGGVAAFYSLIHIPRLAVVQALRELKRVLQPRGVLLVTFHIGSEIRHLDELLGKPVSLDFLFFEVDEMKAYLTAAGFELTEVIQRDPYPEVEVQTQRAYIFARKAKAL